MVDAASSPPPPDDELIIGLVSALGIDLEDFTAELRTVLSEFGYHSRELHLTDAFADFDWPKPLVTEPFDERVWSYMDAGDTLRQRWERNDAMGMIAILQIGVARAGLTGDAGLPSARTAYILRSLKRPEEIALLRTVYGRRFFLIGVATDEDARIEDIETKIRQSRIPPHRRTPVHTAQELINRDEKDDKATFGQNVRDAFHRADLFIDLSSGPSAQLTRALDAVHGCPRSSPSKDEVGMMHAATAALRSAELGRQVGAAICTPDGAVVATGANEVPKAFGGQYWEGEVGDARDIVRKEDTNTVTRGRIGAEIARELRRRNLIKRGTKPTDVLDVVESSRFGDVIEYVRAVHAEMAAITDAARRGAVIDGCTLYTTTFPCHHCARHILASGLARVVYISPYAKSLALDLHQDAMMVGRARSKIPRVPFEPFVGVGPRRYGALFNYESRKEPDGTLKDYDPMTAPASMEDRDPPELRSDKLPYLQRERRTATIVGEAERASKLEMKR